MTAMHTNDTPAAAAARLPTPQEVAFAQRRAPHRRSRFRGYHILHSGRLVAVFPNRPGHLFVMQILPPIPDVCGAVIDLREFFLGKTGQLYRPSPRGSTLSVDLIGDLELGTALLRRAIDQATAEAGA
jgi:hypothetical protein